MNFNVCRFFFLKVEKIRRIPGGNSTCDNAIQKLKNKTLMKGKRGSIGLRNFGKSEICKIKGKTDNIITVLYLIKFFLTGEIASKLYAILHLS